MSTKEAMKCYKSTFQGKMFLSLVIGNPMCDNSEVGSAVLIRPYTVTQKTDQMFSTFALF